jgi:hypothetical protein
VSALWSGLNACPWVVTRPINVDEHPRGEKFEHRVSFLFRELFANHRQLHFLAWTLISTNIYRLYSEFLWTLKKTASEEHCRSDCIQYPTRCYLNFDVFYSIFFTT